MAKRVTQLTELTTAAVDDYLPIVDTSTGTTKKITVKNLTGLPDLTWIASGESWSYSAWDSTLKRGTIVVPTDATTKYQKGMYVRFSQSTGGTKYGKIISVTSTTIVVFMNTYTLNNEAISSPVYSPLATPIGVPNSIIDYNPYKFSAYKSSIQGSIVDVTFTKLTFDTERFDSNSNFASSTYTAPVAGFYQFAAYAVFTFSAGAVGVSTILSLYVNGVEVRRADQFVTSSNATLSTNQINDIFQLSANDTVEVYCYVDTTSGTGTANSGVINTRVSGYLISET